VTAVILKTHQIIWNTLIVYDEHSMLCMAYMLVCNCGTKITKLHYFIFVLFINQMTLASNEHTSDIKFIRPEVSLLQLHILCCCLKIVAHIQFIFGVQVEHRTLNCC